MFFAGLEIDLPRFRQARTRTAVFGVLTTGFPLLLGTGVGLLSGSARSRSIVLGSLLASHTLLAARWSPAGADRLEPVTLPMGPRCSPTRCRWCLRGLRLDLPGRAFGDLAGPANRRNRGLCPLRSAWSQPRSGVFCCAACMMTSRARWIVLLLMVAIAGLLAQAINLPGIVGAFLVGLAVNRAARGWRPRKSWNSSATRFSCPSSSWSPAASSTRSPSRQRHGQFPAGRRRHRRAAGGQGRRWRSPAGSSDIP